MTYLSTRYYAHKVTKCSGIKCLLLLCFSVESDEGHPSAGAVPPVVPPVESVSPVLPPVDDAPVTYGLSSVGLTEQAERELILEMTLDSLSEGDVDQPDGTEEVSTCVLLRESDMIPVITPCPENDFVTLGKILSHGFVITGYFPPFCQLLVLFVSSTGILKCQMLFYCSRSSIL